MTYIQKLLGIIALALVFLFLPFYLGKIHPQAWFTPPLVFLCVFGFAGVLGLFIHVLMNGD